MNNDLISRTELFKAWLLIEETQDMNLLVDAMVKETVDAPAVDAVQVVRCRDCMWWAVTQDSLQGKCLLTGEYPAGGWYCANGCKKCAEETNV